MNFLKIVWKRTFGTDGGSLATITNELDEVDLAAVAAFVIRSLVVLGLTALVILIANAVGVPFETVTNIAEKIKGILS